MATFEPLFELLAEVGQALGRRFFVYILLFNPLRALRAFAFNNSIYREEREEEKAIPLAGKALSVAPDELRQLEGNSAIPTEPR